MSVIIMEKDEYVIEENEKTPAKSVVLKIVDIGIDDYESSGLLEED